MDDDHDLALAVLIFGKATINALLFQVGGLDVAAEIFAVDFSRLAFIADNAAFHFLSHGFAQLVQQNECRLVGEARSRLRAKSCPSPHCRTRRWPPDSRARAGCGWRTAFPR